MSITNASFLEDPQEVVHGTVMFEPIGHGALIAMRQGGGDASPRAAARVIGRDDHQREYTVLYADARGVSRVYQMSLSENIWRSWRDEPINGRSAAAREKRASGGEWEPDFDLAYTRDPR